MESAFAAAAFFVLVAAWSVLPGARRDVQARRAELHVVPAPARASRAVPEVIAGF